MKITAFLSTLILLLASCQPEIKPIDYGTAECDYCRMTIVNEQYAAELVSSTSKVYVFDAVECMLNFLKEQESSEFSMILVTDYKQPKMLIDAKNAYFVRSKELPSPMGMYITSVKSQTEAKALLEIHNGSMYNFQELKDAFPSMKPL